MKLKRLTASILAGCTIFAFVACSEEQGNGTGDSPSNSAVESLDRKNTLAWENCPEMPFVEMLRVGMENMAKENEQKSDDNMTVEVTSEDGWTVKEHEADDVKEPYTYILKYSVGEKGKIYHFLMDVIDGDLLELVAVYDEKNGKMDFEGSDSERITSSIAEYARK